MRKLRNRRGLGGRLRLDAAPEPRWLDGRDLVIAASLAPAMALSWVTPERLWLPLGRLLAEGALRVRGPEWTHLGRVAEPWVGRESLFRLSAQLLGRQVDSWLQVLRHYRPGGWPREIALRGGEHLEASRERGKGAVLWVGDCVYSALLVKMALHQAGYSVIHMSRPEHGFSESLFGVHVLNPIRKRIEDRYLGERVNVTKRNKLAPLRTLIRRLRENRIVSITLSGTGGSTLEVPLASGRLRVATAAPQLALNTGATLHPVFTRRTPEGEFEIVVEAALEPVADGGRSETLTQLVQQFAVSVERFIKAEPGMWRGWDLLEADGVPSPGPLLRRSAEV